MEQSSTNRAINVLRKVTSMVLPRPGTPNDLKFKFASEADIKALRTMISMLTVIQKIDRPIKGLPVNASELVPSPLRTDSEHKELKILSALATVLVMEHEVVAVVAKHVTGPGGVEEVVACTDSILDKESEPPKSFMENFIATYNPRFSDKPKHKLAIHSQADDFQNLTKEELLDKFKAGTKKEKNKL
jgi:hypothetical protein